MAHAGRQLQSKVEEQEEIIEAGLFEGLHVGSAARLIDQESGLRLRCFKEAQSNQ